jgi:hypothetical protein
MTTEAKVTLYSIPTSKNATKNTENDTANDSKILYFEN